MTEAWVGPHANAPPSMHDAKYLVVFGSIFPKGYHRSTASGFGGFKVVLVVAIVEDLSGRLEMLMRCVDRDRVKKKMPKR